MNGKNGARHSMENLYFKFGLNREGEQGALNIITLWIGKNFVAQTWENQADKLRKIAKQRRANYVIRDSRGHVVERGSYGD